ncbi:MAG: hypothetical protein HUK19_05980 [Fibrobacter sp.]|nr:hypothetical protein [Fibrobacter sp.]
MVTEKTLKKAYQKATLKIIEIEADDVLTTSGGQQPPTRQIENIKKQSTDDWF